VILTGGMRTPSDALVGPVADQAIRSLNFDVVFVGCHGISASAGLSTPNLAEAETNRALVGAGRRLVALADHTKWGLVGLSTFASLSAVDVWVTDPGLSPQARAEAAEHIQDIQIA
jgi:DeoR/GlpR family transcriptional regulator of sugar metabolism